MTKDFSSLAPSFNACRCEHYAVVSLSGADAATFLHGQVSNDIEHLGFNEWTLAAYCNPKG
ncbi:MAG: folate-binding protein, partial [Proteobacteria bacterium]